MTARRPIGFLIPDEAPGTAVHESCEGQSASMADREGIPIFERGPDAGRHRCERCGKRIGQRPPKSRERPA